MTGAALISVAFTALAVIKGAGCQRSRSSAAGEPAAAPTVLRIAFVPQVDMEERYASAYRALESYLKPALGIRVEIVQLESVTTALEGLRAGKLHMCNFSPWPFLLAEEKVGIEPLLVTGAGGGVPVSYRSVIIARPALGLRTIDDLKARAGELTFSFEEPVSTSGHLVPRRFFHAVGIDPVRDFKRMLFSPDSTVSILAIKSGRLDVAAVSNTGLARAISKQRIVESDVTVIWTSEPVLANLVAIRRELPAAFKDAVRQALVAMATADPAAWAHVVRQYSQPVSSYLPATAAMLEPFRRAIREVPGLRIGE